MTTSSEIDVHDHTPVSAQSLRELRAEMLQRAAALAGRARTARRMGHRRSALALQQRAEKLVEIARSVRV